MHEVGHNLGLAHSGEEGGSEYGDETGTYVYCLKPFSITISTTISIIYCTLYTVHYILYTVLGSQFILIQFDVIIFSLSLLLLVSTGVMGSSQNQDDGPSKCFNGMLICYVDMLILMILLVLFIFVFSQYHTFSFPFRNILSKPYTAVKNYQLGWYVSYVLYII